MSDRDRKQKPKDSKRKGSWDFLQTIQDPDSNVGLILSERMRGAPGYSMQIVHLDDMGPNKHVPMSPPGAKHELKHIVYSLVERAQEIIAQRRVQEAAKKSG